MRRDKIARRDFLKLASLSLGSMALRPWIRILELPDFPVAERLGRVCVGMVELKARPDPKAGIYFCKPALGGNTRGFYLWTLCPTGI